MGLGDTEYRASVLGLKGLGLGFRVQGLGVIRFSGCMLHCKPGCKLSVFLVAPLFGRVLNWMSVS